MSLRECLSDLLKSGVSAGTVASVARCSVDDLYAIAHDDLDPPYSVGSAIVSLWGALNHGRKETAQ